MILTPGSQLRCLKPFGLFNSGRESLIAVSTLVPIKADRRLVACFDRVIRTFICPQCFGSSDPKLPFNHCVSKARKVLTQTLTLICRRSLSARSGHALSILRVFGFLGLTGSGLRNKLDAKNPRRIWVKK